MADFNLYAAVRCIDPSTHLAVVSAVPIASRHAEAIVVRDRLVATIRDAVKVRDALLDEMRSEIVARGDRVIGVDLEIALHPTE